MQRYGLAKAQWDEIFNFQNGRCALCEAPPSAVDHDHETGRVRGLLCAGCNFQMSAVDDEEWLKRALEYRKEK